MNIEVKINDESFYRPCRDAFVWNGVFKDKPSWLLDMVEASMAYKSSNNTLWTITRNGLKTASVGDIVILVEDNYIDIFRLVNKNET